MGDELQGIGIAAQVIPTLLVALFVVPEVTGSGRRSPLRMDPVLAFVMALLSLTVLLAAAGESLAILSLHDGRTDTWRLVIIYGAVAWMFGAIVIGVLADVLARAFMIITMVAILRLSYVLFGSIVTVAIWMTFALTAGLRVWAWPALATGLVWALILRLVYTASAPLPDQSETRARFERDLRRLLEEGLASPAPQTAPGRRIPSGRRVAGPRRRP